MAFTPPGSDLIPTSCQPSSCDCRQIRPQRDDQRVFGVDPLDFVVVPSFRRDAFEGAVALALSQNSAADVSPSTWTGSRDEKFDDRFLR